MITLMKRTTKYFTYALSTATLLVCASCVKDINLYQPEKDKPVFKEEFFDFNTTGQISLKLDYATKGETVFYLYSENPVQRVGDSWELRQDIDAIYAGVTDAQGCYSEILKLPSFLTSVWLYTDHVLISSPIELPIVGGMIQLNYSSYKDMMVIDSRASMSGISYPDGYEVLGTWDVDGIPDYLLVEKEEIPAAFLKRCNTLASSISTDVTPLSPVQPAYLNRE